MTHMTFLTIDQRDEEAWYDQNEDKDKQKDKHKHIERDWMTELTIIDKLRNLNHNIEG